MDELRTNLASLEQSRTIKDKTAVESRKTISKIGRELVAIGSGGAALDSAEQELNSAVSGTVLKWGIYFSREIWDCVTIKT